MGLPIGLVERLGLMTEKEIEIRGLLREGDRLTDPIYLFNPIEYLEVQSPHVSRVVVPLWKSLSSYEGKYKQRFYNSFKRLVDNDKLLLGYW